MAVYLKKSWKTIFRVLLLILLVVFFFPFCTVSCGKTEVDISGLKLAMGDEIEGYSVCIILFLVPIIIFLYSFYSKLSVKNYSEINLFGVFVNISVLSACFLKLQREMEDMYFIIDIQFRYGFYLEIIDNIILICLSIFYLKEKSMENIDIPKNENLIATKYKSELMALFIFSIAIGILLLIKFIYS